MTAPRIAITGIGLITSLGLDRESSWSALCQGKQGSRLLTSDDFPDDLRSTLPQRADWMFGAPVSLPRSRGESRLSQLANLVSAEAIRQRGGLDDVPPERRAVVLGTSKTDLGHLTQSESSLWTGHACANVSSLGDFRGASLAPVAACATGLISLIRGAELIRQGDADLVLAGSVDASLHPAVLSSYRRLGVLARPGDDTASCCRPFDRNRTGFSIGEGGAVLMMEPWETACRRRTPLAEWLGGIHLSDPTGIAQVDESGDAVTEVCRRLLRRLSLTPQDIDSVSLHGTATHPNDLAESRAINRLLGIRSRDIPAIGIKGSLGHLLGAAGAVETALAVLSLRDQRLPGAVNLREQDPDCLLWLPRETLSGPSLRTILKVSLGFGGHLAAAVLRAVD